ncbi:oleate hydratase [Microterricola viridarii]|uniref:Oleate hydratase n=1 Tax=Microterricola viridarii TaxID=412690 RepID=A0A1H1LID0_9MICO|nr:oleate hydratase [Microterricola viridarii]SDR74177.1 oleate hydratase [Microterricola viridarii]
MYYSNGNYEAFARPKKPDGVDSKSAYLVGAGLSSLAAAAFLIRDGQMKGERITVLEASSVDGGALDGAGNAETGWLIRGGREMEDHFECLWDLYRSIPSLEVDGSVLDEFYWLNKEDPNFSLQRATINQGQDAQTGMNFTLGARATKELTDLVLATHEQLYDKRINEVMGQQFFDSNFWLYWRTMFAFEEWHSALEMKLYVERFIHHIDGLPDFSALKFTKYNQYESLVMPLVAWLRGQGVKLQNNTRVMDVTFDISGAANDAKKVAKRIVWIRDGVEGGLDLTEDDLVFVTNGSLVENSQWGDHKTAAAFDPVVHDGGSWHLWRNIAAQHPSFGRPDKFCTSPEESQWESASITTLDERIPAYIEKIAKRPTRSGKVVTGGIVSVRDSAWLLSWTVNRQPHFKAQPDDQTVVWFYGLFTDVDGDYVKKPMRDCTGEEITREWLFHLGVPVDQIDELAATGAITRPCMMPFITAFFLPRTAGDRPEVVPEGVVNFAFIGQFAESTRDCIFTTEYSVRTGMEAVYQLLGVDRGVPEVFGSIYDVRQVMKSVHYLRDGKNVPVPGFAKHYVEKTMIGQLLEQYKVI